METAIVIDTPEGIAYARLASLKGRIRLEKVGLKSSGGSTRKAIASEFGLKPRDSHDKFIDAIQARMNALLEARVREALK